MLDILLQIGVSLLIGAAVGYTVSSIVEGLSRAFVAFWEQLVAITRKIWGYVTETTQSVFAAIAQWLDTHWDEIKAQLIYEFGYRSNWWVALFRVGREIFVAFLDPQSPQEHTKVISLGALEAGQEVQLPTEQDTPRVLELSV